MYSCVMPPIQYFEIVKKKNVQGMMNGEKLDMTIHKYKLLVMKE